MGKVGILGASMIRKEIKSKLTQALKSVGKGDFEPEILPTTDSRYGDYYTNTALKLANQERKQAPAEIAKSLVAKLPKSGGVFDVEVAKNGFLNFKISPEYLQNQVRKINKEAEKYGFVETSRKKKARVEFVSANPTGPLHIGNARGGPIGDTIASVLEMAGYKVLREYLQNDIGGQIDKIVEKMPKDIKEANRASAWATEHMLGEILGDCERMGIEFDKVQKESELESKSTGEVLEKLKKKGALKDNDGAVWFAPSDEYLKDREAVVIKSDGQKTYFANDIAYHNLKFSAGYDLIVDELGAGHDGHIPKLKSAISSLGLDVNKFKVVVHQNVRVKRGSEVIKMSKRAGNFVTAREVLDEVGKDAFRFFMLMFDASTHMDFDLEQAKSRSSENPVYYVQYAHARASSILKRSEKEGFSYNESNKEDTSLLTTKAEVSLMRQLARLPELVEDVAGNFAVHLLPNYATGVADLFHKFYESDRVIGDDKKVTQARLSLVLATKIVLKNTLTILGVSAPEKM
jgi:arginyl-tRNA synthetase